jgi:N-acetylmuramoyl-L-alanine amidase
MSIDAVQRRLTELGYSPGKPDGIMGPKTERALRDFGWDTLLEQIDDEPLGPVSSLLTRQPVAKRPINEIIVHCTATPEGREVSVGEIRQWHKERGFADIGYHYVVHLDGIVEAGRPEWEIGAHVAGHNTGTLGVVYVGGVEADDVNAAQDTRTPEQKVALMALCRALVAKYPKISKISGHNEYAAKACPSFDVQKDPLSAIV